MRALRLMLMIFCIAAMLAPDFADAARQRYRGPLGTKDPRYAAIILNPETGEVYHEQNASAQRIPASLTKMMTLYLLFEALEARKITMQTQMRVSDYASMQPQTNISLTTRDRVPVELAIKALIIRSANDVAVVVAEHLGGSVPGFAEKMNAKARALGMRNTTFKNPHGLPDSRQRTTARDMAKLSIALKRDYPQYYKYFANKQFSWRGVNYYTHNRVMLRYSGTDGIKTGYTIASGFNVATSSVRGGRPLIGVVLGGGSGAWRDDRMIALMNQSYTTLAKRPQQHAVLFADNLPLQRNGLKMGEVPAPPPQAVAIGPDGKPIAVVQVAQPVQVAVVPADRRIVHDMQTAPFAMQQQTVPMVSTQPGQAPVVTQSAPVQVPVQVVVPQVVTQPVSPSVSAAMPSGPFKVLPKGSGFGIQVGAYSNRLLAERAALKAFQQTSNNLQGSRISVVGTGKKGAMVHRARLENISEPQAKQACAVLISKNSPCFIFRSGTKNL